MRLFIGMVSTDKTVLRSIRVIRFFWFKDPVDTTLLPDYNTLVPKKDARDLGMIKQKLTADKYDSLEALIADFNLLARNAIRYNGSEDPVAKLATQLADESSTFIAQMKKKRKSMADEPSSSSKKASNGGAPAKRAKLA
jgi:transcription initiation factor TFIID subunit 2